MTTEQHLEADERETLMVFRDRPLSIAVLAEHLGLGGTTVELRALCDAMDALEREGLIEQTPDGGFLSARFELTARGYRWLRERDVEAMAYGIRVRASRFGR